MDRIVSVRVRGFRAIDDLTLDLGGLTVLVGENGTGKSTLIEALQILAKAAQGYATSVNDWLQFHGSFQDLVRASDKTRNLAFEVRIEGEGPSLTYSLGFGPQRGGNRVEVAFEDLTEAGVPTPVIARRGSTCNVVDPVPIQAAPGPEQLVLTHFGANAPPSIGRVMRTLAGIRVHVPLDLRPLWVAQEEQRRSMLRQPIPVEPAQKLERLGLNLANCYLELLNRGGARDDVLEDVRAGLGSDVLEVSTPSSARGYIDLAVRFRGLTQPVYSAGLSDGQLTYLALVALRHMNDPAAALAFDEPETHLHPALLARAVWIFDAISKGRPVILATHSDALLDALPDPARQAVVLELDDSRGVRLRRLSADALDRWRSKFSSLGEIRRAGMTHAVLAKAQQP